jgi:hypothetical protein
MRCYTSVHEAYGGIDLHARTMVRLCRQPRQGGPGVMCTLPRNGALGERHDFSGQPISLSIADVA